MIHYTCVYIRAGLGAFAAWAPGVPNPLAFPLSTGPEPQKPPARLNIYTCMVYHACAGPFWRMRQSILANAPIHFIECAYFCLANVLFYSIISFIILLLWYHYIFMLLIYFLYVVSFWHTKQSRMTLFQVSLSADMPTCSFPQRFSG